MNKEINTLKDEIKELSKQKNEIEKETDAHIKDIIKNVMSCEEEFDAIDSASTCLKANRTINDNQEISIILSYRGQEIDILLRTFDGKNEKTESRKALTISIDSDKCNYHIAKHYEPSRTETLFLVKEASRLMSEDDSLMAELLSQVTDELKNVIG